LTHEFDSLGWTPVISISSDPQNPPTPFDMAALLKMYLGKLPEPLLSFELYDKVVQAGLKDPAKVKNDLFCLAPCNWNTLRTLMALLTRIAAHASTNGMDAANLAMVLAPVLLWPPSSTSESKEKEEGSDVREAMAIQEVVQYLIENSDDVFSKSNFTSIMVPPKNSFTVLQPL